MSLKFEDLKGTILPDISLDEFEPKSGEDKDIVVIAFYVTDEDPADDLNTFIQRGPITIESAEVSPSTDEAGRYLVFVELKRDKQCIDKFKALVKDIENVSGKQHWKVKPYLADKAFDYRDPALLRYVALVPEKYKNNLNESDILSFIDSSFITNYKLNDNKLLLNDRLITEVVDIGNYDEVIGRNNLDNEAFRLGESYFETKSLETAFGNCSAVAIDNFILLCNNNNVVMLTTNTQSL